MSVQTVSLLGLAERAAGLLPAEPVFVLPLEADIADSCVELAGVLSVIVTELGVSDDDLAGFLGVPSPGVGQACAHMIARHSCEGRLDVDLPLRVGYAGMEASRALRTAAELLDSHGVSQDMRVEASAWIRGAVEVLLVRAAWPYRWIKSRMGRDGRWGYWWDVDLGGSSISLAWPNDEGYASQIIANPGLLDEEDRMIDDFGRSLLEAQTNALTSGSDHLAAMKVASLEFLGGGSNAV